MEILGGVSSLGRRRVEQGGGGWLPRSQLSASHHTAHRRRLPVPPLTHTPCPSLTRPPRPSPPHACLFHPTPALAAPPLSMLACSAPHPQSLPLPSPCRRPTCGAWAWRCTRCVWGCTPLSGWRTRQTRAQRCRCAETRACAWVHVLAAKGAAASRAAGAFAQQRCICAACCGQAQFRRVSQPRAAQPALPRCCAG